MHVVRIVCRMPPANLFFPLFPPYSLLSTMARTRRRRQLHSQRESR